jgi:arabinogalactan oligomer / maltooligosaccharide transport system permease protein
MTLAKVKPVTPSPSVIPRFLLVAVIDIGLVWLIARLFGDGSYPLVAMLSMLLVFITVSFSIEQLKPYRWMALGLSLMMLFVLYPIFYTIYLSTTNVGHGHVLTKQQAIASLEREQYVPTDGQSFKWTAFQSPSGDYTLWLQSKDGAVALVKPGERIDAPAAGTNGIGSLDENGIPTTLEGYQRLERRDVIARLDALGRMEFGVPPNTIRIASLSAASTTQQRYRYDAQQDTMTDQETGLVYRESEGTFTADTGETLTPGFFVAVGTDNFSRFFSSAALRGPLTSIVIWNFTYALLSVALSFALGLFIAILFDKLPGKRIIRTLLIIPYPIPALVSILIWRNLLNPDFGALVKLQEALFGTAPNWLTNPTATRVAILIINMWLSYPYFYIVSSGALQAIPSDMLDAAEVDGANVWQKFSKVTFPLLLQIVSPLLVASFAFNFNNFNLIYIFNEGNPPIAGSPVPAGHTDILISFVYKLAFNSAQSDYGLASAISIVLFVFVGLMTWFQFRYTRVLEDQNA